MAVYFQSCSLIQNAYNRMGLDGIGWDGMDRMGGWMDGIDRWMDG